MSTTLKKSDGVSPWLITNGMPSFRRCCKGNEGEDLGRDVRGLQRNEQGCGVKKPQEAQKATALWKMKAAEEAGEDYLDLTRRDWHFGKNTFKIQVVRWRKP